jgi:hypothetical protein
MALDRTRTLRGALAGAVGAAVWAAQQPLDRRLLQTEYDDVELLGKALTRGESWPVVGLAVHIGNGAAFGALYANTARSLPLPAWARGPAVGLAEHLAGWPLVLATDRFHPARRELPVLWGSGRAFAAATWRHLLFGVVMGELERRLNPPSVEPEPVSHEVASSNGHGSIEHLVGVSDS